METAEDGSHLLVKLSDGEDLFSALEQAATRHRIEDGAVLWGIGMVQDFEIGFFTKDGYVRAAFPDRHELLALHGSLAMRADPRIHLHVAAGRPDHSVIGGHLFRAKACVVNEILLTRFDGIRLTREFNPATGLRELIIEPPDRGR
jgi:hypothetical protein